MTLRLNGVHHTARPTWKLKETFHFYREVLGLPLAHCVSARGWGPVEHPDFLHFFFDSGNGSTIAFFYYLGTSQPAHLVHRPEYDNDAIHTAWRVESRDELQAWRDHLEGKGVEIMFQIEHEVVESIYFRDPNGYYIEIGTPVREFVRLDADDAELTMRAAVAEEAALRQSGTAGLVHVESIYRAKGRALQVELGVDGAGVTLYVPDLAEFRALIEAAGSLDGAAVLAPTKGYWRISSETRLSFSRKQLKLRRALWNSALAGGFCGKLSEYSDEVMTIEREGQVQ